MKGGISEAGEVVREALFAMLRDEHPAPDAELPNTGVPLEIERLLSPPFVKGDTYGTRCSTIIIIDAAGRVTLSERSFAPGGGKQAPTVELDLEP